VLLLFTVCKYRVCFTATFGFSNIVSIGIATTEFVENLRLNYKESALCGNTNTRRRTRRRRGKMLVY